MNISWLIDEAMVSEMSFCDGQMSFKKTSLPVLSSPRASFSKSKSIVPASA